LAQNHDLYTHHERPENTVASKQTKLKLEQQEEEKDHSRHETQHGDEAEPSIGTQQVARVGRSYNQQERQQYQDLSK
jgi:hypothetical protein